MAVNRVDTGVGAGLFTYSYETINQTRNELYDITPFIQVLRSRPGVETVFKDVLPPVVKKGTLAERLGCGRLPNFDCITSFQFTAQINKTRSIDTISDPCDFEKMTRDQLAQKFLGDTSLAWGEDEIVDVFEHIEGSLSATTTVDETEINAHFKIEKMILEVLQASKDQLGIRATKRKDLIVVLSPKIASDIRALGFTCCDYTLADRQGNENRHSVKGVYEADFGIINSDILVYDPRREFTVTMCETGVSVTTINQEGYKPNSNRIFGMEYYGFQTQEFAFEQAPGVFENEKIESGVKYTAPLAP